MGPYCQPSVSQAAAIALRQLQDQLSGAYADIAKLQQEKAELRKDVQELADAHNSEQQQSDAHIAKLAQQIKDMHAMLKEMKDALETTAEDNSKLQEQLTQSKKSCTTLGQDLSASRYHCHVLPAYGAAQECKRLLAHVLSHADHYLSVCHTTVRGTTLLLSATCLVYVAYGVVMSCTGMKPSQPKTRRAR